MSKIVSFHKKGTEIKVTKKDGKFLVEEFAKDKKLYSLSYSSQSQALDQFHKLIDTLSDNKQGSNN